MQAGFVVIFSIVSNHVVVFVVVVSLLLFCFVVALYGRMYNVGTMHGLC